MARDAPPRNARTLRRWVDGDARAQGIATARLQRWVSYMVLAGALDRVRGTDGQPVFIVKGGVALELRLRLAARATKDLDATCRERAATMIDRLDDALREPSGAFSFTRGEPEPVGPTRAVRVPVALAYAGRSWSTVPLELSPPDDAPGIDFELVPAIDLTPFGLEGPAALPCLSLPLQIAQKLHACTARRGDGKDNDRFRDLVDVILMRGLLGPGELDRVRQTCVAVFAARAEHGWPPELIAPASWAEPYARLARELDFDVGDVSEAVDRVRRLIHEIAAATPA